MAQPGSAHPWGGWGRWFKSSRPDNLTSMSDPLQSSVQYLKGVGPYLSKLLAKRNVHEIADLLYYFPNRYLDRSRIDTIRNLQAGKEKTIIAEVVGASKRSLARSRRGIYEILVKDEQAVCMLVFFQFNETYLRKKYPPGKKILISGECKIYRETKQFVHPDIQDWDDEADQASRPFVPVYPLTEGLHQKTLRRIITNAIDQHLDLIEESSLSVRAEGEVKLGLKESIAALHFPPAEASIEQLNDLSSPWHQRVAYDEVFFLQLGLAVRKSHLKKRKTYEFQKKTTLLNKALSLLPFELTLAQKRVVKEIQTDLNRGEPMNRLVQGDVGCGKTMVAFLTALPVLENKYQVALMAPTEVLAVQHVKNLMKYTEALGLRIALLSRSIAISEKKIILEQLKNGDIDLLIGTHAILQDDVIYKNLAYVIIDEQHRFGVKQRASLKSKGQIEERHPHLLVMTATPIPRTLSMTLYGDLDISIIDEKPSQRKEIITHVFNEKQRTKAYGLIDHELDQGRQIYFIYPLIEESEKVDLKDAVSMADKIQSRFKDYEVALMHGKMKAEEKDDIMNRFKKKEAHILVSTTVIEVGVDVPNASVMIIEHAERFGLSQLHQLRGRVGRGVDQSYCILMAAYARSDESKFRLKVMEETTDGFKIAEEDLNLRGPGDFLGTRQSGLPEFRLSSFIRSSTKLLSKAQERAREILLEDPLLSLEKHRVLKSILKQRWENKLDLAQV